MFTILLSAWAAVAAPPELNDTSFAKWRDFIKPRETEQAYLDIPWRESFYLAVNEARETGKPILLWTMNGHPLGCT